MNETTQALTLTDAQRQSADAFQQCLKAMEQARLLVRELEGEIRTFEAVLPVKREALARATEEYGVIRFLLQEHLSLYRDLMGLTPEVASEPIEVPA